MKDNNRNLERVGLVIISMNRKSSNIIKTFLETVRTRECILWI